MLQAATADQASNSGTILKRKQFAKIDRIVYYYCNKMLLFYHKVCPASSGFDSKSESTEPRSVRSPENHEQKHPMDSLIYPLVNVYKKLWKDPPFQAVNPLFLWSFSIAMLNYQRAYLSITIINQYQQ